MAEQRLSGDGAAPVVELEHVAIELGRRTIWEDVSLTLQAGEFTGVIGPNGAGKTSLLRLLLGMIKPVRGVVRVLGQAPRRGNVAIGFTPQRRTLESETALRGRDLVGLGIDGNRWGIGLPHREHRLQVERVLEEVGASAYADAPIGQLSGGEQQRLLIAQALLTNPRLFLLDEPLASLDITNQHEIVQLVARVCRERKTAVLLVTHDVNPLLPVLDRLIYVARGHCAVGTPDEIITSEVLTHLYGSPVQVLRALGRVFVVNIADGRELLTDSSHHHVL